MLFSKEIEPRCAYCQRGSSLGGDKVICLKKGIVSAAGRCRRFKYDPLKRIPQRPINLDLSHLSDEDFKL